MAESPLAEADQKALSLAKIAFGALEKAIKSMNLYSGKGEFVTKNMEDTTREFAALLRERDHVNVRVTPFEFTFLGQPVYQARQGGAGFSYKMFSDGVRDLTFAQGLTREEIVAFIDIVRADYRQAGMVGQDTVTRLWEQDFQHVEYHAIDLFAEAGVFDSDAARQREMEQRVRAQLASTAQRLARPNATRSRFGMTREESDSVGESSDMDQALADFPHIVLRLAAAERADIDAVRAEVQGGRRGLVQAFMGLLFVMLSRRDIGLALSQAQGYLDAVADGFLERQDWEGLLQFVQHVTALSRQEGWTSGERGALVSRLMDRLAAPEQVEAIAGELEKAGTDDVPQILALLGTLPPATVPVVARVFLRLAECKAKLELLKFLLERGADLTDYFAEKLKGGSPATMIAAVRYLRDIASPKAVQCLKDATAHHSLTVRREVFLALRRFLDADVRRLVQKALQDGPPEMRGIAVDFLLEAGDQEGMAGVVAWCESRDFRQQGREGQKGVLARLAASGRPEVWAFFARVLAMRSLLPRKAVVESQKAVIDAIAASPNPEARRLLQARLDARYWRDPLAEPCRQALALSPQAPAAPSGGPR